MSDNSDLIVRLEAVNANFELNTLGVRVPEVDEAITMLTALERVWDMLHFDCSNPDHAAAYQQGAIALGYKEKERCVKCGLPLDECKEVAA